MKPLYVLSNYQLLNEFIAFLKTEYYDNDFDLEMEKNFKREILHRMEGRK